MIANDNKKIFTFLIAAFVVVSLLVILSTGAHQGGDTYQHFMIAKWAFKHPYLFLDHWGKPFFTALFAPASQLGYTAAKLLNTVLGFTAAWYTFLLAKHLRHRLAWPAAFMLLCAPIYFVHLNSAMTEILFSTIIIVSTYYIATERWYMGALILSFLPFVRTEGFVLIPFISLWFLMHKKWMPFIALGFGTVVYSILGGLFYFHDFMWVFNKNPYEVELDFYGSGNWHHFISTNYVTWGVPTFIALCAGTYWLARTARRHFSTLEIEIKKELFIVVLPAVVFLLFHSLAWWLGKLSSVGEIRVLASVMPLYAIIASRGFNWMVERFSDDKKKSIRFQTFYCVLILLMPFLFFPLPMKRMKGQAVMHDISEWLEEYPYQGRVWYFDPQIAFEADADPFEPTIIRPYFFKKDSLPSQRLQSGDILIWDAHFGPNEGRTPLSQLSDTSQFQMLKLFKPEKPFETFDSVNYEVKVFLRK
jgi:hypothetical protein